MKKERTIALGDNEHIIAVVPEYADGPGWRNAPTWVYIRASDLSVRSECIQPNERTLELHALFAAGAAMCGALKSSIPTEKANR